jgi:lipopolysaccharide export system protein LptC
MSLMPLPVPGLPQPRHAERMADTVRRRPLARVGHRHLAVAVAKCLLPVVALILLSLVALWPEYRQEQFSQVFSHGIEPLNGLLTDVRYSGVDDNNRPYTVTAVTARQIASDRVDLVDPKADISVQGGDWLMVQSRQGVYVQRDSQLDLSGEVVLYRDDGLTMVTDVATVDFKAGVASGVGQVHAEGPFGTLDAQGFSLGDRGQVVQFAGPGRVVLNGQSK